MSDSVGENRGTGPSRVRTRTIMIVVGIIAALLTGGIWAVTLAGNATENGPGLIVSSSTLSQPPSNPPNVSPGVTVPSVTEAAAVPIPSPESPAEASARAVAEKKLATIPQPTAAPVAFTELSKPDAGVTAKISDLAAVDGKSQGPGQVSGPSIRFTLILTNNSNAAIDTGMVVVNVEGGADHVPALVLSGPGAVSFPASTAPGKASSGTFVFLLPNSQRNNVRIFFNFQISSSIAVFEGAVPKAQG